MNFIPRNTPHQAERVQAQLLSLKSGFIKCVHLAKNAHAGLGRFMIPLRVVGLIVVTSAMLRLALFLWFADPQACTLWEAVRMFLTGVQFDVLAGLFFALPQALALGLLSDRWVAWRGTRFLLQATWFMGFMFLPFLIVFEWLFFDEFQSRLNYIAFEYLVYPTEVCCNIWESYPIVPMLVIVVGIGLGLFAAFRRRFLDSLVRPLSWMRRALLLGGYLTVVGSLWSLTNMNEMEISENRIINECANNGLYSFVYYAWTCRFDFDQLYLTIDEQEAFEAVQAEVLRPWDEHHAGSANPLDRTVRTARPRKDYNVVIVLEESLGADFIGVLGDERGLSPHFDELSKQGLVFDNFYATGNRTARALEAVLTSLPPLPTEAILKRDHSDHVYTMANVLANRGYQRLFMTGGRGLFDGVESFMVANGFDQFREQSDYESPAFTNAWGVSDEDLFRRAVKEFDRLHETGQPFFSVVLTVSNHRPYTYPKGRISEQGQSRENAVKYADWALGQFFREARSRPFYKNTIFVVMGDHGARVYGSQVFPLESYRVPVLLIHPEVGFVGRRNHTLGCSMDIAPTILGLLGGSYRSTFFGRDLTQLGSEEGFALMQHNHDVALLESNHHLTVLSAGKSAWKFRVEPTSYELILDSFPDPGSLTKTIAYYQTAYQLYYGERCYPNADGP